MTNVFLSHSEAAKSITLEMGVRLPNDIIEIMSAKNLEKISLVVQAVPVTPQLATNFTFTFDVLEPHQANVSTVPVTASEADVVVVDPANVNAMITGARAWVDFGVRVPLGKTTPLSVAVLAPVEQNRLVGETDNILLMYHDIFSLQLQVHRDRDEVGLWEAAGGGERAVRGSLGGSAFDLLEHN